MLGLGFCKTVTSVQMKFVRMTLNQVICLFFWGGGLHGTEVASHPSASGLNHAENCKFVNSRD